MKGVGSSVPFDNITVRGVSSWNPEPLEKTRHRACFPNLEMNAVPVMGTKLSKYASRLASGYWEN